MELLRVGKSVRKVIKLQNDSTGKPVPVVLYEKTGKKRKISRELQGLEKGARRIADAQNVFASTLLMRHNRSNQKRRDGWVRDLAPNVIKAARKSVKRLRVNRILGL